LERNGIEVITENLYGNGHRQVTFNVSNGEVWSRQIRPSRLESSADHYAKKGIQK
jgi:chemotaxis protein CheD